MRAKELALSQASGAVSADSRSTAAVEIDGLLQQTLEAGNAQWGNQFLFAGRKTDTAPFLANGTYQGNSGTLDYEIGQGNFMTVNTPGNVIFGSAGGGVDVIKVLQDLKAALATNDQSGVGSLLNSLDRSLSQVVNARTNVGVKMERLIAQKDQLEEVSNQLTQRLGETEGVDLAKTISDLTHQQYVYEASLAASAKIIQTTLLDFLR
jgi:flagellar hook-associated protein 3 FlgL